MCVAMHERGTRVAGIHDLEVVRVRARFALDDAMLRQGRGTYRSLTLLYIHRT